MLDPSITNFPNPRDWGANERFRNNYGKLNALRPITQLPSNKAGHILMNLFVLSQDEQVLFNKQSIPFMFINTHNSFPLGHKQRQVTYYEFLVFHKKCFVKDMRLVSFNGKLLETPRLIVYST